jgi:hypothetical protein
LHEFNLPLQRAKCAPGRILRSLPAKARAALLLWRPCLSLSLRYNTTVKYTSLLLPADVFSFSPKVLREKESAGEILFLSIQANKQKVFIIVLFQCLLVARRAAPPAL